MPIFEPAKEPQSTLTPNTPYSWDRSAHQVDQELSDYFATPKGKIIFFTVVVPLILCSLLVEVILWPFRTIVDRLRHRELT